MYVAVLKLDGKTGGGFANTGHIHHVLLSTAIKPLKLTIAQIAVNSNIFAIMACVAIVLQQCAIFILLADYLVLFSCKIAQFSYQIENCRHVLFGFCLIIDPNCS